MKTTAQRISYSKYEILCFHIGLGGRFYNPGHLTFVGTKEITKTSDFDRLFPPRYKNGNENLRSLKAEWRDECGNSVELTNEMIKTGVGIINFDNDYDTTYTTRLGDLSESEIEAIQEANPWDLEIINNALIELGLVDQDEIEEEEDDNE
jgi:hypothetical protein